MKALILSFVIATSLQVQAHEGHGQAPGTVKALHGGIVKTGKNFNLEMVSSGTSVEFFPTPHEDEKIEFKDVVLSATSKSPKGKPTVVELKKGDKSFKGEVNFDSNHRLNLEVSSSYQGKKDLFKFLVEQ